MNKEELIKRVAQARAESKEKNLEALNDVLIDLHIKMENNLK